MVREYGAQTRNNPRNSDRPEAPVPRKRSKYERVEELRISHDDGAQDTMGMEDDDAGSSFSFSIVSPTSAKCEIAEEKDSSSLEEKAHGPCPCRLFLISRWNNVQHSPLSQNPSSFFQFPSFFPSRRDRCGPKKALVSPPFPSTQTAFLSFPSLPAFFLF